ncbi:MAG TPA: hypothetical protein VEG84_07855, partial [Thermoanaerobaculia bacterium]|nr:hypothetical protein [Thermoanaerobaculia bacterium]
STQAVIPNVANSPAGASIWTSEVQIANLDPAQTATVSMTYYPIGGAAAAPVNVMVPPGGTLEFDDIVASLFQAAPSQGAILLTSNIPVAATQRAALRLLADGSEYSSQSAALDVSAALPPGGGIAIGASATQARRTNLLLFNNGPAGNVTVTAFDASGATLGHLQIAVGDHAAIRVNRVLAAAGGDGTAVGRILVEPSAGMSVYAQTVDIDGVTGDTEISNLR